MGMEDSDNTCWSCVAGLLYLEGGAVVVTTGADAQVCFWATGEEEPNSFQVRPRRLKMHVTEVPQHMSDIYFRQQGTAVAAKPRWGPVVHGSNKQAIAQPPRVR